MEVSQTGFCCVCICVCVSFCVVVYTNLRGPWVKAIISKVQWVGIKYHSPARGGLVQFRCDNNSWQKIRLSLEGWNPVCHALKCMCLILFSENVMGPVLPKMNIYHIIAPPLLSPGLLLFFNMSLNSKVWKWKTGELSARRNEKRKLLKPPSFSLSLTSSSPALPSGECFGAQLIFCLHNAFLQALYLCQSSFWSESGYHRLPTRCSCEWRNPPVMQDLCVCVRVRLCVCVCWSLGPSFQGKFTIN